MAAPSRQRAVHQRVGSECDVAPAERAAERGRGEALVERHRQQHVASRARHSGAQRAARRGREVHLGAHAAGARELDRRVQLRGAAVVPEHA